MANTAVHTFGDGVPNIVIYTGEPSPKKKSDDKGPKGGIPLLLVIIGMIIISLVFWVEVGSGSVTTNPSPAEMTPSPTPPREENDKVRLEMGARTTSITVMAVSESESVITPAPVVSPSCVDGCTEQPSPTTCRILIKADRDTFGRPLYFQPGQDHYDEVEVDPTQGEFWFCEERDARIHGFTQFKEN